jgi:phosphatidylethanolamine-binding protein (PEBP) family uncharacterized protein
MPLSMVLRPHLRSIAPLALAAVASVVGCSSDPDTNAGGAGTSGVAGSTNGGGGSGTAGSSSAGSATGGNSTTAGSGTVAAGAGGGGASSGGSTTGGAGGGSAGNGGTNSGGAGGGSAGGSAGAGTGGSGGAAGGAGGGSAGGSGGSGGAGAAFALTSPAWTSEPTCSAAQTTGCGVFPKANISTMIGGENKSPQLDWTAGPSGTMSYAIVLRDLTNMQGGKPFVHWVMWNIPASTRSLPAGLETTAMPSVPAGSSQRSYSGNGFQGSGKCGNVYEFVLYALTSPSFTPSGANQTAAADGLAATGAPTASLRARSGPPGCTP